MTALVGILNITPDSFSDGGKYETAEKALDHALQMVQDGATIIDLGAESTRPGAHPLHGDHEWDRLAPVLNLILKKRGELSWFKPKISIDTRHQSTVKKALNWGVDWINDVSGGQDPELCQLVAQSSADYVLMHSLSVPADPAMVLPAGVNATTVVADWFDDRLRVLESLGLARHRVIIDPGIGFGKTATQSIQLLRHISCFQNKGARLLVGHSRKSFLSKLTAKPFEERDFETIIASLFLLQGGIDYVRVHDVAGHAAAFRVAAALKADDA